ncbi:MAG: FkbM family methyltransferase [Steroidobacteraceae bacterium]
MSASEQGFHSRDREAPRPLERFLTKAASAVGMLCCRYRGHQPLDGLARVVARFHQRLDNVDFEMHRNGELRVLEIMSRGKPRCLFDVGANKGDWTATARRLIPACTIHAFEIVPETFKRLEARLGRLASVHLNDCGLSSQAEQIEIHLGPTSDTATACRIEGMRFHEEYYRTRVRCAAITAADYMRTHGIDQVDLVKIDVEGMDLQVIRGFGERLRDVRAIQFEYGIFNIASHDLLSDFYRHLQALGFLVGKIFPRSVAFLDYHFSMENFHGSNFLAVRDDEVALIEKLAGRTA